MNRELCQTSIENFDENSLEDWLKRKSKDYHLFYLLAHAEDGVIWGRFEMNQNCLITAREVFPNGNFPELRLNTLQQCRIFGKAGEVLLWKSNGNWRSRLILETKVSELMAKKQIYLIPESHILWGTKGKENSEYGFTLLSDGSQGLKHAVPMTGINFDKDDKKLKRPVKLEVHHYFYYDSDGVARIFLSRLVDLKKS